VLWIFLNAYPDLPVWAKLCRAYGAESGIGASSTQRINQKLKEPALQIQRQAKAKAPT
jgi:hypothetical protein